MPIAAAKRVEAHLSPTGDRRRRFSWDSTVLVTAISFPLPKKGRQKPGSSCETSQFLNTSKSFLSFFFLSEIQMCLTYSLGSAHKPPGIGAGCLKDRHL